MSIEEWGSFEWNENHFPVDQLDSTGDTWGMRWKGMDKFRHQSYLRIIRSDLKKPEPIKFLDIGCALCDFTLKAWNLNQSNMVWAMDMSPTATDWNTIQFPDFTCRIGAAPEIPFDIEFDIIFILEILCYLDPDDRARTMHNANEKLVRGGKVLFSGVLDGGVQHHTTEEIVELISRDFEIEKIHFNHWSLYRTIVEYPLSRIEDSLSRLIGILDMPRDEFHEASKIRISGTKLTLCRFLRATKPLSIWILKGASWLIRRTIGWAFLAKVFHLLSRVIRGPKKADEIVVLAVKPPRK